MSEKDSVTVEMPKYRCHKEVWALKIREVVANPDKPDFPITLHFEEPGYAPIEMGRDFANKHFVLPGGYYVVYKDGYRSFSPGQAFDEGYTKI